MIYFSRKFMIVTLAIQALLTPIGFSGVPPAPFKQLAIAASVPGYFAPIHKGRRARRYKRSRFANARIVKTMWVAMHIAPLSNMRRTALPLHSPPHRISPHLSVSAEAARAIRLALRIAHEPRTWSRPLEWLAFRESTDNPRAIAYEGVGNETAQGLFQVLPSTFAAHALPGMSNIWSPVDNTVAAIRYIADRYGTPQAIPGIGTTNYAGY